MIGDKRKVEDALAWAYRNGYCFAEDAAKAWGRISGRQLTMRDLGQFGNTFEFVDKE